MKTFSPKIWHAFKFFCFPKWKVTHFFLIIVDDGFRLFFILSAMFLLSFYEKICEALRSWTRCRYRVQAFLDAQKRAIKLCCIAESIAHPENNDDRIENSLKSVPSLVRTCTLTRFLPPEKNMIIKQNVYDLDSLRLESSVVICSMEWKLYNSLCTRAGRERFEQNFLWKFSILCADQYFCLKVFLRSFHVIKK